LYAVVVLAVACGLRIGHAQEYDVAPLAGLAFHVSPNGNDTHTGSQEEPFASLERVRDAVRAELAKPMAPGPIEVILHAGVYELSRPLTFMSVDFGTGSRPVIWRAATGEEARVCGGRYLHGLTKVEEPAILQRLDPAARSRIMMVDLKAQGISVYGVMTGGRCAESSTGLGLIVKKGSIA
jgi:hypothetical protein